MHANTAELVDPVLERTCRMRDSAASGDRSSLDEGRSALKELLSRVRNAELAGGGGGGGDYLGIVYPLVCWIDEVMTAEPMLGSRWNENKLEGELFGTNDRAWMFWRQADLAATLGRSDDLAVFFLCVSLGFTGRHTGQPEKLAAWMHRMRVELGIVPDLKLPFSNDLAPPTDVPPMRGVAALRRASHVGWTAAVVLLPVLSYLAVIAWSR